MCVCVSECVCVCVCSNNTLVLLHSPQHLYNCAGSGDIPGMLCAVAHGANVNFVNDEDFRRSPLIQTIYSGSVSASEFLFLNGVRPNIRDCHGQGILHHCVLTAATKHLILFLKKGAADFLLSVDMDGKVCGRVWW